MNDAPLLLITRPIADAKPLSERVRTLGYDTLIHPLLDIHPLPTAAMPLEGVQALLATSANGIRALGHHPAIATARPLPLFAVGPATKEAARHTGFTDIHQSAGDGEALAQLVMEHLKPSSGPLLHLAGQITSGILARRLSAQGFEMRRSTLYDARPVETLSADVCARLKDHTINGILFYSARTADVFMTLYGKAGLGVSVLSSITAYCLAPPVARTLQSGGFGTIVTAPHPDEQALLSCLPPIS
ncbi:MAG: uroporphyrinogen-III synthase [Parvularculales bacterium]